MKKRRASKDSKMPAYRMVLPQSEVREVPLKLNEQGLDLSSQKKGERCPVPSLCTSIYIARHKGLQSGQNQGFFLFIH